MLRSHGSKISWPGEPLIRTFLTLEGIAGRVDPDFNIYEMAMPWAMRRSLSPESAEGIAALRALLLTRENRIQWQRVLELVEEAAAAKADAPVPTSIESIEQNAAPSEEAGALSASNEAAKAAAMNDAVGSLLGTKPGRALRRALADLDSIDLAARLVSADGRPLRRAAAAALADALESKRNAKAVAPPPTADGAAADASKAASGARPVSETALRLRELQERRRGKVLALLLRSHLSRQLRHGLKGALALASIGYFVARVALGALWQSALRSLRGRRGVGGAVDSSASGLVAPS